MQLKNIVYSVDESTFVAESLSEKCFFSLSLPQNHNSNEQISYPVNSSCSFRVSAEK